MKHGAARWVKTEAMLEKKNTVGTHKEVAAQSVQIHSCSPAGFNMVKFLDVITNQIGVILLQPNYNTHLLLHAAQEDTQ